jgi:DNA-binding response OmpR family regulator
MKHIATLTNAMRVLLVEDEPDLGAAIKRTLNQAAYVKVRVPKPLYFTGDEEHSFAGASDSHKSVMRLAPRPSKEGLEFI